jgi:predicted GTPase
MMGRFQRLNTAPQRGWATRRQRVRTSTLSQTTVPIIGRPNVGKSTLFNRLVLGDGKRRAMRDGEWPGGIRRQRGAIVSPLAGTSRDRREAKVQLAGAEFMAVDTGGLDDPRTGVLNESVNEQVRRAIVKSHLAIFVLDAREGVTPMDRHFALWARRQEGGADRSWIVLLNKAEGIMARTEDWNDGAMADLARDVELLGLGDSMLFLSAKSGDGLGDLVNLLLPHVKGHHSLGCMGGNQDSAEKGPRELHHREGVASGDCSSTIEDGDNDGFLPESNHGRMDSGGKVVGNDNRDEVVELAIVGRPNAGKSSLVNAVLRDDRVIVGPNPGVTRDAIAVDHAVVVASSGAIVQQLPPDAMHGGAGTELRRVRLVDTAGIRKYSVDRGASKHSGSGEVQVTASAPYQSSISLQSSSGSSFPSPSLATHGKQRQSKAIASHVKKRLSKRRFNPPISGTSSTGNNNKRGAGLVDLGPYGATPSLFHFADAATELRLEQKSIGAALSALRMATVVLLVLDADIGAISRMDLSLAGRILDEGRALVVCANKADLLPNTNLHQYRRQVSAQLEVLMPQHGAALPVVALSALTGEGVELLLPAVLDAHDRWTRRVATARLNNWLAATERHHPHPMIATPSSAKGRAAKVKLRFKYITQLKARPPTFVIWTNRPESSVLHSYASFLRRSLRAEFDFHGIPIRVLFRSTSRRLKDRIGKGRPPPTPRGLAEVGVTED